MSSNIKDSSNNGSMPDYADTELADVCVDMNEPLLRASLMSHRSSSLNSERRSDVSWSSSSERKSDASAWSLRQQRYSIDSTQLEESIATLRLRFLTPELEIDYLKHRMERNKYVILCSVSLWFCIWCVMNTNSTLDPRDSWPFLVSNVASGIAFTMPSLILLLSLFAKWKGWLASKCVVNVAIFSLAMTVFLHAIEFYRIDLCYSRDYKTEWPKAYACHGVFEGHRPPSILLASITPIAVVTMAMPWMANLALNSILLTITTFYVYRMSSVNNNNNNDQTNDIGEIAGVVFNFAYTLWAAYIYEFIGRNTYYQLLLIDCTALVVLFSLCTYYQELLLEAQSREYSRLIDRYCTACTMLCTHCTVLTAD
jgi:hypothetical protein